MKNSAVILLGGNMGDVLKTFKRAIALIEKKAGKVTARSAVYKSEPWGITNQEYFLNQVIIIRTKQGPAELLNMLLKVEKWLGRNRTEEKYTPRTIDIDILFYNNEVIENNEIEIPHPRLHLRRFALEPLNELMPGYIHPALNVSLKTLLENCPDKLKVELFKK